MNDVMTHDKIGTVWVSVVTFVSRAIVPLSHIKIHPWWLFRSFADGSLVLTCVHQITVNIYVRLS